MEEDTGTDTATRRSEHGQGDPTESTRTISLLSSTEETGNT